jgi:hypothetical protein
MDLEMKAYEYDDATGDWSHLCSSLNASFHLREGSAMVQVAPPNAAQTEATQMAIPQLAASGEEDDEDNADSADSAAVIRRIAQESEKLHRLLQGVSSTQLSEPALAALMALKRSQVAGLANGAD